MAHLRLVHDRNKTKTSAGSDLAVALPFILALALAVIAGLGAAHAHAMGVDNADLLKNGVNRSIASEAPATERFEGLLRCDMGSQNTGSPCEIKLQIPVSGRVYKLSEAALAQALFHSGKKKVSIEGSLADADTIRINRIQTISN